MLWWLIQNLIVATAMAVVVFAVCRFRRIGPAGRHVLWSIVLLKLVTPPLVFWPWPAPWFVPPMSDRAAEVTRATHGKSSDANTESATSSGEGNTPSPERRDSVVLHSETFVVEREPRAANHDNEEVTSRNTKTARTATPTTTTGDANGNHDFIEANSPPWWSGVPWVMLIGIVWLAGSILTLLRNILRIVWMNRIARSVQPAPESLARQVGCWAQQLGIRPPPVRVTNRISSPVIWAAGRPLLLWPAQFADDVESETWQGVLVHELAHLKRRDHWVGRVELLAACVWWWNPLFWYTRYQVRENSELACDAWVVGTFPDGRRAYAEALLLVCENTSPASVPAPALGVGSGSRRHLERRLTMILREKVPFRASRSVVLAVVVLALVTLPGWTQSKKNEPSRSDPVAKETTKSEPKSISGNPLPNLTRNKAAKKATGEVAVPAKKKPRPKKPVLANTDGPLAQNAEPARAILPSRAKRKRAANTVRESQVDGMLDRESQSLPGDQPTNQALLQKVRQLQREVEKLRARDAGRSRNPEPVNLDSETAGRASNTGIQQPESTVGEAQQPAVAQNNSGFLDPSKNPERVVATHTITLQRTTYRLPPQRAKALQTFLQQNVKAEVLQIEIGQLAVPVVQTVRVVDPGTGPSGVPRTVVSKKMQPIIKITTTPELQKVIGQMIAVMRKDAPANTDATDAGEEASPRRNSSGSKFNQNAFPGGSSYQNPTVKPFTRKKRTRPATNSNASPFGAE